MINPEEYDVVELLVDLPDVQLQSGQQGTILHIHSENAYEVEFANSDGETLAYLALNPKQFIVIWKNSSGDWVPVTERIYALVDTLPEDRQAQVLEFTRSLHGVSA